MSLWTRTNKPHWVPNAVVGKDGWVQPVTNETLVTFDTKGGATIILSGITNGPFVANETVTGTSTATGVVATYDATTKTLVLNVLATATFLTTDTLTGGTSGATATIQSIVFGPGVVTTPTINSVTFYKGFVAASGEPIANKKTAFVTGDYLEFSVQFNSQIKVTGQPYLTVTIGGSGKQALYVRKAGFDIGEDTTQTTGGTATLLFVYRIQSGDSATVGNVSASSPIQPNSGTITSYINGNSATLTFTTTSVNAALALITVN